MTDSSGEHGGRFQDAGRRLDQRIGAAVPRIEEEVKKVIAYLNDEVVPSLRQDSAQALRSTAEQLRKLANYLDDSGRPPE